MQLKMIYINQHQKFFAMKLSILYLYLKQTHEIKTYLIKIFRTI